MVRVLEQPAPPPGYSDKRELERKLAALGLLLIMPPTFSTRIDVEVWGFSRGSEEEAAETVIEDGCLIWLLWCSYFLLLLLWLRRLASYCSMLSKVWGL